ncbi:MAG TPA: hypothetical protein VGO91_12995 [Pyrinomonadaceae bacterium]|jgi:hypothetical protein|nr:hypothetical protein [Pyrinomonadaceae bacterium]
MRKALIAFACVGAILLVAGSLALSHGRTDVQINPVSEATMDNPVSETTTDMTEPAIIPDGTFEIEVLVDGRPLEEYYARGRRYVEALEGAEYELRIYNPLPVRVAVALSVDGLNTIDARRSTAWNASKWAIEPYGTINIRGWQMSSERARHFYFTSERDSYGAKLGRTANLGTINAVFFRERSPVPVPIVPRPHPTPLEDEERRERSESQAAPQTAPGERNSAGSSSDAAKSRNADAYPGRDDDYAATGIGRSVHHDVTWINMDLDPRPSAEVAIRYEYRSALVRLGILPKPYPHPDPLRRRERSTGFDDHRYSPEP